MRVNVFRILLLLFVIVPLVEFALLYQLSVHTSLGATIALVLVTGVVGAWLARAEGVRVWRKVHSELARGQTPSSSLLDALMIVVAGGLLVAPGVLGDLLGISLLIPPCRSFYKRAAERYFRARIALRTGPFTGDVRGGGHERPQSSQIIDSYVVDSRGESEPK